MRIEFTGRREVVAAARVAFEANRAQIEKATKRVLEKNGGQSVELETRDFDKTGP